MKRNGHGKIALETESEGKIVPFLSLSLSIISYQTSCVRGEEESFVVVVGRIGKKSVVDRSYSDIV